MDKTQEDILFFAFRYALGRRTGAVCIMVQHLKKNWGNIESHLQSQIKQEIKIAIDLDMAGSEFNIKEWQEILKL